MTKRWLGLLVVVLMFGGLTRSAYATVTESPDPNDFSDVYVGTSATQAGTLVVSGGMESYATVSKSGADCGQFSMSPTSQTVSTASGASITVTFSPTAGVAGRGMKTCTFNLKDGANTTIGSFSARGNGIQRVVSVPSSVSFPSLRVANGSPLTATQNLTITNTGNSPLTVSNISLGAGDFSFPSLPAFPQVIAGGNGTLVVSVAFDPTTAGTRTATVTVASDDPVTPNATSTMTGFGTNAILAVADLDVGVIPNGTGPLQSVVVSNTVGAPNNGPLRIKTATLSGSSWFTLGANGNGCTGTMCTINSGPLTTIATSANLGVICTPSPTTASGTQTAMLTLTSDSDPGADSVAMLSCTAGRADVVVSATTLAFADTRVATNSAGQTFTISNTGSIAATYNIVKSGSDAGEFVISTCGTSGSVPALTGVVTCTVTFHPNSLGAKSMTITVTTNDPDPGDGSQLISPVTGSGVAPQISSPASLDFGSVDISTSSTMKTLTITNSGTQAMQISSATIDVGGTIYSLMSGLQGAQTVPASSTAQWSFACTPTAQGPVAGQFKIISDSLTSATFNVAFTCNGQRGVLGTNPTAYDFGPQPVNVPVQHNVVLENTGNLPVTGIATTFSSTTVGYTIDASTPVPTTLAAGANAVLKINFLPTATADGGPATITFTGTWTGVAPHATMAVLTLNGDGRTADVSVDTMVDFGSFRWDSPQDKTFCITNGSQSDVTIQTIAVNPAAGTMTGEFVIGTMVRSPIGGACGTGSPVVGQPVLSSMQNLQVTVTAVPASRVGMLMADVAIMTNLMMSPVRHVALTGISTSGAITVSPGVDIDLGAVDVDTGPVTQTVTITNSGAAPFDVGSFLAGINPAITLTLPANTTLAPTESVAIGISYDPAVVSTDTVILSHSIAHVLGGPTMGSIMIHGRGIDRTFSAAPLDVTFPDTFKNPGATAPTVDVVVTNTGEAPLHISAVMVEGGVYSLLSDATVDIPGGGSNTFKVMFTPTMVGPAPAGALLLTNDDDLCLPPLCAGPAAPTLIARIPLMGMGLGRQVSLNPTMTMIDVGYTGVGIPVTLSGVLVVQNMDDQHGFTIHEIRLGPNAEGPFTIEGAPTGDGITIGPSESKSFDLTFSATTEGFFERTAVLYLDNDPDPQGTGITLQGHAVFIDLHGGGGCATGNDLGGGAVIALGALVFGRRKRRRMLAVVGGVAGALLVSPATSLADNPTNLDVGVFNPTPSTIIGGFQVQTADVGEDGDWVAGGVVSFATKPLVAGTSLGEAELIGQRTMFDFGGAYAFLDRFEAGARMPLYTQNGNVDGTSERISGLTAASGTARGDLTLHGKARLVETDLISLGAGLALTLPTATSGQYTGTDLPSVRLLVLGTFTPHKRLTINLNAGGVLRQTAESGNIKQGSGLAWGGAVAFRALDKLWLAGEVFGEMVPSGHKAMDTGGGMAAMTGLSPIEGLVGLNFRAERRITVGLAIGGGLTNNLGAPKLRGVFAVTFAPGTPELKPIHPPPPPKIDGDADSDGIKDSKDKCPNDAEDFDQFDDLDGCPDPDNDQDGVLDAKDKCPLDAEDRDKFQDEDGCPERDNDNDGIPDAKDKCPDKAEDKDGFQDVDGCPDLDNDRDGIPDDKDKCPNEAETINGIQDDDGCPDKGGDSVVVVSPDRLETLEAVQFTGVKITKASFSVLGQVAATLRAHPEIIRIRVTTHVQPSGNTAKDQELTEKRAAVVREWLIQWGIAAGRIEARGFGGTKPLVPATNKGAALVNDRLELIILERK